jgi:hypothetical protein
MPLISIAKKPASKQPYGFLPQPNRLLLLAVILLTIGSATSSFSFLTTTTPVAQAYEPPTRNGVMVEYRSGASDPTSASIIPQFRLVNHSDQDIALGELSMRYWYTIDGDEPQEYNCDYAPFGCEKLKAQLLKHPTPGAGADYYLEISFSQSAGLLAAHQTSGPIIHRFNKRGWKAYNQTNDYSFARPDKRYADFYANERITLYRNGQLIWGTEPSQSGPNPTVTATPSATATATIARPTTTIIPTVTPRPTTAAPTATATPPVATITPTLPPPPITNSDFVIRQGSQLFLKGQPFRIAGPNMAWLGLDEFNDQGGREVSYPTHFRLDDGLTTAQLMGATVVRSQTLGISVGCDLCLMPTLGKFNEAAFEPIDYALASARRLGLKVIIPLVDQWDYYHGGKLTFARWRGYNGLTPFNNTVFYTDPLIRADFKSYVNYILNHRNQYTGQLLKDDPTILAWESGNEIWDASDAWTKELAEYLKALDPNHLVSDGSAATGLHLTQSRLSIGAVDLFGGHFYPIDLNWLKQDAALAKSMSKVYYVGEYDWQNSQGGQPLADFLNEVENNSAISGDLYWELRPHSDNGGFIQHEPPYDLHYGGGTSDQLKARVQLLVKHAFTLRGISAIPTPPVPAQPSFIQTEDPNSNQLRWRGVAGAVSYSIERATAGPTGPWTLICDKCATDENIPWADQTRSGAEAKVWYRLKAHNLVGVAGPYSPVYTPTPADTDPNVLTDNLNDFTKLYSHSANVELDGENASFVGGDPSRMRRTSATTGQEEVVWHWQAMRSFEATVYFWPNEPVSPFEVYLSGDGTNWQKANPTISGGSGDWKKYVYALNDLNGQGVNFVRLVWTATSGQWWNGQIGKVVLKRA